MQSFKLVVRIIRLGLSLLGLSVSSANAAILNVVGGELQGATGIDVGGRSLDVSFLDGTCIALFSGCNETSDFPFHTEEATDAAMSGIPK